MAYGNADLKCNLTFTFRAAGCGLNIFISLENEEVNV